MKFPILAATLAAQRGDPKNSNRWLATGIFALIFLVLEGLPLVWLLTSLQKQWVVFGILSMCMGGITVFLTEQVLVMLQEHQKLKKRVSEAEHLAADAFKRLSAVFRLSQKFVESSDERDVVDLMLRLAVEFVGAKGASFVPIDERGQPLTAVSHGEVSDPAMNSWIEYLASPSIRNQCGNCQNHDTLMTTCPLIRTPFANPVWSEDKLGIYCLPLRRGEREYGVLNMYLEKGQRLDSDTKNLIRAMVDESSLALESVRLRTREMATLRQLQEVRRRTDLSGLLANFVQNIRETLKADFAYLVISEATAQDGNVRLESGNFPHEARLFLNGLLQGVASSAEPLMLGEVSGDAESDTVIKSILAAPLMPQDGVVLGAVLVGNYFTQGFSKRQLALLQTLAGQVAMVVKNAQLMAELEFKTMMAERIRLAREIHDGLAQTIGFLKLQNAQMQNFLTHGEMERLKESLRSSYKTLADAYLDARQAIDGLRIGQTDDGLAGWLEQTIDEFQENSGLDVKLVGVHCSDQLPVEVQIQLIRIIQEALSNVRKHAQATTVRVACRIENQVLVIEVKDNGRGFNLEDVPSSARYGLQGMRERTALIGAEFKVKSVTGMGTTVEVRVPCMGVEVEA